MKATLLGFAAALMLAAGVSAQTVYVTPANPQGFTTDDTRPGGAVTFVADATAPGGGIGALRLTTDATTTAKAQYMRGDNLALGSLTDVSYYTKQTSGPSFADPSFQLPVCLGGFGVSTPTNPTGCIGFTTLVFEPYQNNGLLPPSPAIVPGAWQMWDVDAGQLWSSRTVSAGGGCSVSAGFGGPPFYTIAGLAAACPSARAVSYGVNIGSNNPSYDVSADLLKINGTTYDFEPFLVANDQNQCKKGGWMNFSRADGSPFKNQGDCIQYVNTGR